MSPVGLISVPDPSRCSWTACRCSSRTVAASARREHGRLQAAAQRAPLAGVGLRCLHDAHGEPPPRPRHAGGRAPLRIRPHGPAARGCGPAAVLLSGGVIPSSSPVAGSPRRSTTDSVMRSGPRQPLAVEERSPPGLVDVGGPPSSEVITPWICLDTSGFTDTSSSVGSRPTRTCAPTGKMRCRLPSRVTSTGAVPEPPASGALPFPASRPAASRGPSLGVIVTPRWPGYRQF